MGALCHLPLRTFHGRGAGFRCERIPLALRSPGLASGTVPLNLAHWGRISVVALLSAVLLLALEAATMADDWRAAIDPGVITAVLADTDFGRVWLFRLFLAVALTAVVLLRPQRWATITVAAGLLLASLALVGHAAMRTGFQGVFQRGNSAVHLLAAGAWLGGLTAFIGSLGAYAVDGLRRDAVHAMARFSASASSSLPRSS